MASYAIHLAVAKEYIKKHKDIKDTKEFIKGTIAPDKIKEKLKSHYGPYSARPNLVKYLKENRVQTDYEKGYFFHLLVDYCFYNIYFKEIYQDIDKLIEKDEKAIKKHEDITKQTYIDYARLNTILIPKYKIEKIEEIQQYMKMEEGEPVLIKEEIVENLITQISEIEIQEVIQEIFTKNSQKNNKK